MKIIINRLKKWINVVEKIRLHFFNFIMVSYLINSKYKVLNEDDITRRLEEPFFDFSSNKTIEKLKELQVVPISFTIDLFELLKKCGVMSNILKYFKNDHKFRLGSGFQLKFYYEISLSFGFELGL